jgi:cell volume regulation protein A
MLQEIIQLSSFDDVLLLASILLFASIVASKMSFRAGVPMLLFFMAIGMLVGEDGLGLQFNDPQAAQLIGTIALNFILFFGGFDTSFREVRPVLVAGSLLSIFGVLFTAIFLGLFAWLILPGFSLPEGLLLGAVVSSTDAAAVFSVLRSRNLGLRGGLRPMLEFESGSNDPMAYLLTITFVGLVQHPETSVWSSVPTLVLQMLLGLAFGLATGWIGKRIINHIRLEYDVLYALLVMALMLLTYSLTNLAHGNGFLSIYVCAIFLGNQKLIHKKSIAKFFDGMAWLMQITIFIVLGMLVTPSKLIPFIGVALLIAAFLMLVARPLSVFLSLLPLKVPFKNQLFVSWVGLKGAVPIVFATFPLVAGLEKGHVIFNIVFLISAVSVLVQGSTLSYAAKLFGVSEPFRQQRKISIDIDLSDHDNVKSKFVQVVMPHSSKALGVPLVEMGVPPRVAISLIIRGDKYITPYGGTTLEANDKLLIVSEDAVGMAQMLEKLGVSGQVDWE